MRNDLKTIEILAPAGSPDALRAAMEAGANAVYFGLKKLNARQGATNFDPDHLGETVKFIHSCHAKAYLTLNIDLNQRELGLAARTLQLAQKAEVDAVLIKDSALLAMMPFFPKLNFHFSTQAGISSSAGAQAAKELGLSRVVLARELSKEEIQAANSIKDMEIELFVQGAMCFSCSGRCLMSSWIGGRSGNRGACASPCRFVWKNKALPDDSRPFSMHDLCSIQQVSEFKEMAIASLKIEGRLKSPAWVHQAVSLYRSAIDKTDPIPVLYKKAQTLGFYTGRQVTDAYYQGIHTGLTGESARLANSELSVSELKKPDVPSKKSIVTAHFIFDDKGGLVITWQWQEEKASVRIPPQKISHVKRAISLGDIFAKLSLPDNSLPVNIELPNEFQKKLFPKRIASVIESSLADFIHLMQKDKDGMVRISIPDKIRQLVTPPKVTANTKNAKTIGNPVEYLRLELSETKLLSSIPESYRVIFAWYPLNKKENQQQQKWLADNRQKIYAVALPAVLYEEDLPAVESILEFAEKSSFIIEVNSWDAWYLVKKKNLSFMAGPGLAVLNSLAADMLYKVGCKSVAVSPEIDQAQLEALCEYGTVPLMLTVFSRPMLFQTRVQDSVPCPSTVEDGRNIRMISQQVGTLVVFRPIIPMDWRDIRNKKIQVHGMILDLCGAQNPEDDLKTKNKTPFRFNYDRQLR
ncbi:MAG: U32 family peptidase [Lentisphaeria bacterium]